MTSAIRPAVDTYTYLYLIPTLSFSLVSVQWQAASGGDLETESLRRHHHLRHHGDRDGEAHDVLAYVPRYFEIENRELSVLT